MRIFADLQKPAANPNLWPLERGVTFLNHGSFGSCPRAVLRYQREIRDRIEAEPVRFFVKELEPLLDRSRQALARFVGASSSDLVFVPNATSGINTVLRSLTFKPGDELLVTDHEYNACRNALDFVSARSGARIVVAAVPFPVRSSDEIMEPILARGTPRTRLLLVDHVSSQTALVMPIQRIVSEMRRRGVEVLVDGAHAPGMVPLKLRELGAAYYTGNCHKWLCSPKGAAFLHVRADLQEKIRPLSISHGANSPRKDRSRFLIEFGWTGTWDPSAMLSVPQALSFMESTPPGGWSKIMERNRQLALTARKLIAERLGVSLPCPDELIGSIASLPLWDTATIKPSKSPLYLDELQEKLWKKSKIEVPVIPWPAPPKRLLRISAQLYNYIGQYELLADSLLHLRGTSKRAVR